MIKYNRVETIDAMKVEANGKKNKTTKRNRVEGK